MTRRSIAGLTVAGAVVVLAGPALAQKPDIDAGDRVNLICYGEGEKPTVQYRSGYEWDRKEQRYRYAGRTESTTAQFDTEVTVQLAGDTGRIRLPKKLIPPINSNGGSPWWELRDLDVSRDLITGHYKLNGLNSPEVRIDRATGRISIKGIEEFHGTCDAVDPDQRRF